MLAMPITMTVPTAEGTVGFVHAGISPNQTWNEFRRMLLAGSGYAGNRALFGAGYFPFRKPVIGIDRMIVGHERRLRLRTSMNVMHLDTGACYGNQLSMVQIHPGPWRAWGIRTGPTLTNLRAETPIPQGRTARIEIPEWGQSMPDCYPDGCPERDVEFRAEAKATLRELLPNPDPEVVARQGPDAMLIDQLRAEANEWCDQPMAKPGSSIRCARWPEPNLSPGHKQYSDATSITRRR